MRVGSGDGIGERSSRRPDLGGWFTVERLDAGTYAVSEYRHWEETHCYLLLASRNAVLIDTGLGVGDIRQWMNKLYGEAFAAVYVQPGARVAVHLDQQLAIDYELKGRKVDYSSGAAHATADLD